MIARLATALKKLPSEIRAMPYRHARELFKYWEDFPPEHQLLAMFASVYTTWQPASSVPKTEEEARIEHRKSLEARWKAGAMNAKEFFDATGGVIAGGAPAGAH